MSDVNFNTILDTPAEEIKAKPPLPVGTYDFRIKSYESVVSSKKKTNGVEFTCIPFAAGEDVDATALAESGGLEGREISTTYYITEGSAAMLRDFLTETCQMDATGKTLRQLIAESPNNSFRATVTHGISQNGRQFAQIGVVMKIE